MDDNTPQSSLPRPPLGLMPRWLYEEKRNELDTPVEMMCADMVRLFAIKGAVKRYTDVSKEVPDVWLHELKDVIDHRLYSSMFQN